MAITSAATAQWSGSLAEGSGSVHLDSSDSAEMEVTWKARSEGSRTVTTPEELLGAAHAACFNMALAHELAQNGTPPDRLTTTARVVFAPGTGITSSNLAVAATVPGIDADTFQTFAEGAKAGCPVSQALTGVEITLVATLIN
ncbi:OsmC family protein [Klugiella xanthotipulae]|uniref:Osmotically inducible protein OsmC n=1 Tax=Klugiella xanthotipulae TaxID=244735 RepID=A0A543HYU7_9MICO|nr:OsmC family peroxiredoxin [Klugiella xanthotipulae]TQM63489.1 osmotically inducible protein OsmC [Klugiella xanthotipulae]